MATPHFNDRLLPVRLLQSAGIPSMIWFEDALACYNVPTVLFDLHLLVPSLNPAKLLLLHHCWTAAPEQTKIDGVIIDKAVTLEPPQVSMSDEERVKLIRWNSVPATTVLLPAEEWNCSLPLSVEPTASIQDFYPSLPALLDALIDSLLDAPSTRGSLAGYLNCQVGYLYGNAPALRQKSFAGCLQPAHRQFHNDLVAGMDGSTSIFLEHQREIRDRFRKGQWELKDVSAGRENEDLFTGRREAELLKEMPDPFFGKEMVVEEEGEEDG